MPELVVYGRAGCHLCEDMVAGLGVFQVEFDLTIREVDVDQSPELIQRYGLRVPVLVLEGSDICHEICHYFLDVERLKTVLDAHPTDASR